MEIKKVIWKQSTSQYSSGKEAFLGKIKVGSWYWNGIDRDESKRYVAKSFLPGIKPDLGKFPTEKEAIERVEAGVDLFIKEITK